MFCFAASEVAQVKIPHELNIRYGGGQGQLLDIYGTDLPKGNPIQGSTPITLPL